MSERYPVEQGATLDIRARWYRKVSLRVIAADTGRDLRNVHLVYGMGWPENEQPHPGAEAVGEAESLRGDSPLLLPVPEHGYLGGTHTYFAHCPGYAWGRIKVHPRAGGERVLRLAPGGDLSIRINTADLDESAVLRVRHGEKDIPFFEHPLKGRVDLEIIALPGGPWRIALELGEWWRDPIVLATAEVEVVPGSKAEVVLSPADLPTPDRVLFSGEIFLPPEWDLDHPQLRVALLDPPRGGMKDSFSLVGSQVTAAPDREGFFRFDAGMVQPGRYKVAVCEPAWVTSVLVGDRGATDIRIDVPPALRGRLPSCHVREGNPAAGGPGGSGSLPTEIPGADRFLPVGPGSFRALRGGPRGAL